jgi:hypothetical protein
MGCAVREWGADSIGDVNCHTPALHLGAWAGLETPKLHSAQHARQPAHNTKANEMANPNTATRLFRRVRTRQVLPAQPDFADFGTAFGLDMAMQPAASEAVAPAQLPVRDGGWWRRLAARRNTGR